MVTHETRSFFQVESGSESRDLHSTMLWKANIDVEDIDDRQNMRFRIPSRVMSSVLDEANLSQSFKN